MVGHGHRRLALINGPEALNLSYLRRAGFLGALVEAGLCEDAATVLTGDMTEQGGHAVAARLLALPEPPTALVCANDTMAIGAMRAVKQHGFAVPGDVSVTGYDDLRMSGFTEPPLTTLRQPIREAGRSLAEKLLALLGGTPPADLQELWRPELVARDSDGPRRARSVA